MLPTERAFIFEPSILVFPGGSDDKESACNAGGPGLIPGSRRSPGKVSGYPIQYSCLKNPVDRGAGGLNPWGQKDWARNDKSELAYWTIIWPDSVTFHLHYLPETGFCPDADAGEHLRAAGFLLSDMLCLVTLSSGVDVCPTDSIIHEKHQGNYSEKQVIVLKALWVVWEFYVGKLSVNSSLFMFC